MENLCYFVNSRGLLKSCNFHSNNPKSSCNSDSKYLYFMLNNMYDGMSIYVCSDLLCFFVNLILPKINKNFILVTGDSDLCVPIEALTMTQTTKLVNSPFLIRWFAQNTRIQDNDKIIQMPIGLDYHTISNNPSSSWKLPSENHLPGSQELTLVNIKENSKPFYDRNTKIYVNFSKNSDRFGDRNLALEKISKELLEINDKFIPRTYTWKYITKFAFVLSPFGTGMDCHRTWETLCLGSIPIVRAPHFKKLFEDLPVLIVENWEDVTQELLDKTIADFSKKTFNYDKLKLSYWINRIKKGY
jgi:hypothetical protein